ncbi:hypothetical protein [Parabacteroides sp. PFB2-10]|uniref:hypothetical protein n=1 Tax=Parabacteroides sp. PFB2-10 TaxID=1742405 RepID=UPI002476839B|nr:hypothetical protein [Parabacteroides sp. PFB2-10]MDL2245203.1 hypothetical protein [Parabacteroides sp. OttesenSCG-928-J18]
MTTFELELKQSLIRKLMQTDDQSLLEKVKSILIPNPAEEEKEDLFYFSNELKEKIHTAMEQAENNQTIDSENVDKEVQKWLEE